MTPAIKERLATARAKMNEAENAHSRALYALDALEVAVAAITNATANEIEDQAMNSPFYEWERALHQAEKGALSLPPIARGDLSWGAVITVGDELTGGTVRGEIRAGPHAESVACEFSVSDFAVEDGATTFTISLDQAAHDALPADPDADGVVLLVYDLILTFEGVDETLIGGTVKVFESVTL